jgi:HK97 gp10 family phage protein
MAQGVRLEWDAAKVLAEVSGLVLNGMERACQFATLEAKMRVPVRTGKLQRAIDYEVVTVYKRVEGHVGIKRWKGFYVWFVERGTSSAPAHPFLRPAVFENAATIVKLIEQG